MKLFLRLLRLLPLLLAGCTCCGCASLMGDSAEEELQRREDMALVDEKSRRLEGRIETLELEIERLQQQADAMPRSTASDIQSLQASVQELNRRVQAVDAAREKDKQEIIDKLSGKIAQIVSKQSSSSSPAKKSTTRAVSGTGYEHVVEAGQTLSAIASAYGVKQADIIQANDLKEPYMLRVGQKLFVPSP
ncbi:MAG TPA: LysM peptidoglycan-binding domain-containing protein [Kiritimatiellia bacterium]|jgi:LysM repeat protein